MDFSNGVRPYSKSEQILSEPRIKYYLSESNKKIQLQNSFNIRILVAGNCKKDKEFSRGTKAQPKYQHMQVRQILAAPNGFLWQLHLPSMLPISGSDSSSWTRFRILGIIPVARQGGDENHKRSAFGRYIAEAAFWTPAALLPSENVTWQQIEQNTSKVTVHHAGLTQAVDIEVDQTGKPLKIKFMRWSNANSEKVFRLQPFEGYLSDFREVQGFTIPFYVEAGNMFGTDESFPFFKAKIEKIVF